MWGDGEGGGVHVYLRAPAYSTNAKSVFVRQNTVRLTLHFLNCVFSAKLNIFLTNIKYISLTLGEKKQHAQIQSVSATETGTAQFRAPSTRLVWDCAIWSEDLPCLTLLALRAFEKEKGKGSAFMSNMW